MAISGQLWCQFFSRSHYFSHKLSHNLNLFITKTFFSYIFLIRCFLVAIHILFLDKWFDFVGGNCGEAGGRPFYEPRFDRRPGEGGRLLCCLYRSVFLAIFIVFLSGFGAKEKVFKFSSPDDPLTFSVSSPLPLPQVLKTSDIVSNFSNHFLQWYSIYRPYEPQAWLLLLAVMLFMGGNQKLWHWILSGFQVLSWVWSESVAEKRTNAEVSSSIILSLTPSRSISA